MSSNPASKARSEIVSAISLGPSIPKVIYQVYATAELPPVIQENIKRIRALNPGWSYRLFDDAEMYACIKEWYGESVLSYYERINPKYGAARADLFRYLLMYKFGGVYLDIKSSLERPLDDVLRPDDVYVLSHWSSGKGETFEGWGKHAKLRKIGGEEFQQWHIIGAPGHPFLKAVLDHVFDNIDAYNPLLNDTGKNGVLSVTGPIAYTLAITPILRRYPHRLVSGREDLGLIYSIFGSVTIRAHKTIFRFHYTDLQEPVIVLNGARKLAWALLGPVENHVVKRLGRVFKAAQRRFRRWFGLPAEEG
jgi:inositol phosphorylceramide mannosyltransferase catalytic subunit